MRHLQIGDVTSTIERDGRWVPIFPNAKYVFHKREYAAWGQAAKAGKQPPATSGSITVSRSSRPVRRCWPMMTVHSTIRYG